MQGAAAASVSMRRRDYPIDSILMVGTGTAASWLKKFVPAQLHGLHQDAFIQLLGMARHDHDAQALIDTRLTEKGLSLNDRAYLLQIAVMAFAQPGDSAWAHRLPVAEQYLSQLEKLAGRDPAASTRLLLAYERIIDAYREAHRYDDLIRHGFAMAAHVPNAPFFGREPMLGGGWLPNTTVEHMAEVLALRPGGRAQFERLQEMLGAVTAMPKDSIALDSMFYWQGLYYSMTLKSNAAFFAMLGLTPGDIYMKYWVNMPNPGPGTMKMSDGTIHIVEIGGYTCASCIDALAALQRLHEVFPTIVPVFAITTTGQWGNRTIQPDSEVVFLRDMFLNQRKVTIPIGIWGSRLVRNDDGDLVQDSTDVTTVFQQYKQFGKPTIYVVDGKGRIRKAYGQFDRHVEMKLYEDIRFLLDEQRVNGTTTSERTIPETSVSTRVSTAGTATVPTRTAVSIGGRS